MSKNSQTKITTTEVSLPKGGGAIQGIGETFQANEFTGTAALSIPIPTSPCRGFEPQLSVEYSSGSGNGTFGLGWSLAIPNISRKTSKAIPKYDDTDTFLISNAEDLVPQKEETRTVEGIGYRVITYRPRVEGLFAKIERWSNQETRDCYWQTVSKDNVTSIFGKTEQARICDPDNSHRVFQWLLEETFDSKGNYVVYQYKSENLEHDALDSYKVNSSKQANKYIERIKYGNSHSCTHKELKNVDWHFEVVFDYGEYDLPPSDKKRPYKTEQEKLWKNRPDPFSTYYAGFEIRTHRLCRNILMFHRFEELDKAPILVRATQFTYEETPETKVSLLKSVQSTGYRYEQEEYVTKSLPPVEYSYTAFTPEDSQFQPLVQENDRGLPGLNLPPNYQSIDLYGEGIPGVLYSDGKTTLYWEPQGEQPTPNPSQEGNRSVKYGSPKELESFPIERQLQDGSRMLTDLAGDGRMALVVSGSGYNGYYQYDPDRDTWQSWQPFESFPTDFQNPDNQMVDVTGDGLADILLVDSDRLRIYRNQGVKGYGNPLTPPREKEVPMNKNGDVEEVLRFADIFGTGKQHLVRITNGSVECWPNLGYGQFGQKVQLANAPRFGERLDASRLFLVDIDGSGTADIAYVYRGSITIWFNQSGNSFSPPQTVTLPSAWDNLNQINFADVLGNGTTGLVFSQNHPQPRHWYYDFCDRKKPYLLHQVRNNLGAETKIIYASSTKFYLQDKQQGTPWVTKLPFPVQVVEKVVNCDCISNTKLVSCYSYHHGYYDRTEKEFRGFGRVERQDAETLSVNAKATDVPPILTKTWYHTGAWLQQESLFEEYRKEYFAGDARARDLPEPTFDWDGGKPSTEEERQAHVALKGTVLRSEVYGLDGSEDAGNPYSVSETCFQVKLLQPLGENEDAVFYLWERESLAYDYERNPHDPRISHQFTVEIDEYGHVLQDCAVAYGRRELTGKELLDETRKDLLEQTSLKVTYTKNRLDNQAKSQVWLLGVPIESQVYEVQDATLPPGKKYFDWEDITRLLKDKEVNLLSWDRDYYWNESLTAILGLGGVTSEALLARSEVAVVAKEHILSAFKGVLTADDLDKELSDRGKYTKDGEYWWNPGLTQQYLEKKHFYLPGTTSDPFGYETLVEYDSYLMFATKVTDALGNTTSIEAIDYQTLQPTKIRDINDNISEVKMDALGMVILTSHYGTEWGKHVGFEPLTDASLPEFDMETALNKPQTYLQGAASYFYYDLDACKHPGIPVHTVNLIAENYPSYSPPGRGQGWVSPVQTNISYSDGFGREVQTKMRVEPGEAFKPDGSKEERCEYRWLSSGGKVYNNKGNPVREYEPYFINTYKYVANPALNQFGVSSVLHYDPLDRVIRVDTPKGFYTKVEFTPWEEKHYDENDTVLDSKYYKDNYTKLAQGSAERIALDKAAKFYNTPEIKILDNLGRTVQEVQQLEDKTELVTNYKFDIVGNELNSADPRLSEKGIKNVQTVYDLTQTALKSVSVDAGTHWTLQNVMGNPIYAKDSRNFVVTTEYDELHRPIEVRVQGGDGKEHLNNIVERMVYGESQDRAKESNLRGQIYQQYDSAGRRQIERYSIDGLPLISKQQLRVEILNEANWKGRSEKLELRVYKTVTRYNAQGREVESIDVDGNVHRPTYHLSGHLDKMQVSQWGEREATIYVRSIEYNPKGQRSRIEYGNGVTTSYEYEATTFNLTRIFTKREGRILQDLNYIYDPVGNITQIEDRAWERVFNNNQIVDPVSYYTYDALYRLVEATGREHPGLSEAQERRGDIPVEVEKPIQRTNNGQAVENYQRIYKYDKGGNLYRIQHIGKQRRTRNFTVSESSNRAVDSKLLKGKSSVEEFFDGNGNQIKMNENRKLVWNYQDQIAKVEYEGGEAYRHCVEYYVYDSSGSRVRKVWAGNNGRGNKKEKETRYCGRVETRTAFVGSWPVEFRTVVRVMVDETCVAERNVWKEEEPPEGVKKPQERYQLENHLGSATMEVDSSGKLISYEEYFPYGGTAFVAGRKVAEVKLKNYRYSGKERDGSTGLYYYGARYYAPWLGRWMSCDPAGTVDGNNMYGFVGGSPIVAKDIGGYVKRNINETGKKLRSGAVYGPSSVGHRNARRELSLRGEKKRRVRMTKESLGKRRGDRGVEKEVDSVIKKGKKPRKFTNANGERINTMLVWVSEKGKLKYNPDYSWKLKDKVNRRINGREDVGKYIPKGSPQVEGSKQINHIVGKLTLFKIWSKENRQKFNERILAGEDMDSVRKEAQKEVTELIKNDLDNIYIGSGGDNMSDGVSFTNYRRGMKAIWRGGGSPTDEQYKGFITTGLDFPLAMAREERIAAIRKFIAPWNGRPGKYIKVGESAESMVDWFATKKRRSEKTGLG
ncbi:MAG: toxin [Symploca sp. SIO2E6]|nr:toxin [Symploca sp. SIO2E6]